MCQGNTSPKLISVKDPWCRFERHCRSWWTLRLRSIWQFLSSPPWSIRNWCSNLSTKTAMFQKSIQVFPNPGKRGKRGGKQEVTCNCWTLIFHGKGFTRERFGTSRKRKSERKRAKGTGEKPWEEEKGEGRRRHCSWTGIKVVRWAKTKEKQWLPRCFHWQMHRVSWFLLKNSMRDIVQVFTTWIPDSEFTSAVNKKN